MRQLLAAICMTAGLLTVGGGGLTVHAAFADVGNGNSAAAHMCHQGGFLTLQNGSGQAFASEDECVSYAAQGGTLYRPMLKEVSDGLGVPAGGTCGALTNIFAPRIWCFAAVGIAFHPNSPLTITVTDSTGGSSTFTFLSTDSTGSFPVEQFGPCPAQSRTTTITAVDAQGLHASVSGTSSCS